jgi:hypothetical protein
MAEFKKTSDQASMVAGELERAIEFAEGEVVLGAK